MSYYTDFMAACAAGNLAKAKRLHSLYKIEHNEWNNLALRLALNNGHDQVAKWLRSLAHIVPNDTDTALCTQACWDNNLELAKLVYSLGTVNPSRIDSELFAHVCSPYNNIAKWLISIGVDHTADDDSAFRYACREGYLHNAKWVYSLGGVNHNAEFGEALSCACSHGNLPLAKWLYSLGPIDPDFCVDTAFSSACYHNALETAEWIFYTLGGVNIHKNNDLVFTRSCMRKCENVAKWLIRIGVIPTMDNVSFRYRSAPDLYQYYYDYYQEVITAANKIKQWWKIRSAMKNQS